MAVHLLRIIAGKANGKRLNAPKGAETRPMTDRVREALFSSIQAELRNARVLDLYAGSGAVGLEALSRGAASVVFIDRSSAAVRALTRNVATVGLGGEVQRVSVEAFLSRTTGEFDVAFVDPPYEVSLPSVEEVMGRLEPRMSVGGSVILRLRAGRTHPAVPEQLRLADQRRYGDDELLRYEKEAA